jgi:hypothetical protein
MECEVRLFPTTYLSNLHRQILQLLQEIELFNPETGSSTSTMFLGHVKYIHVRKDVLNDKGLVDPGKLRPVTRMGDISYGRVTEGYRIPRPTYEASKDDINTALANTASE